MISPAGTVVPSGEGYTDNGEDDDEFQGGRIVTARWSLVPDMGADRELAIKAGQVSGSPNFRCERQHPELNSLRLLSSCLALPHPKRQRC